MAGTERLGELLARQNQRQLLEAVTQIWSSEGWQVTQVDDMWLRVLRDGQVRHLVVVSEEVEQRVETADLRIGTPVTVVYTGTATVDDLSWPEQAAVLDARTLARRCKRVGVTDDVLDSIGHSTADKRAIANVYLWFLILVPLNASFSVFAFVTYYGAGGGQLGTVSVVEAVTSSLVAIAILAVLLYDSTLKQRLTVGGFLLGGVCYTVGKYVLGIAVPGIVGAVLTGIATYVAARALVALERRTSIGVLHHLVPAS